LAEGIDDSTASDLFKALAEYENRDQARTKVWLAHFGPGAKA